MSSSIMRNLFSPFDKKFEKSLGIFDFGDFINIFVAESLFAFSAAFKVVVCNQMNS